MADGMVVFFVDGMWVGKLEEVLGRGKKAN